jgi:tripartite-type tricarboxylate transporter receptor subunit TctC
MVVQNVTGAGGATGAIEVYQSKADGYTLMSIDSSLTTLEVFRGDKLPFKSTDFEPLGIVMYSPTWIISNTARTYKTIDELIAAARENPGEVSIGTAGPSGSQFLMAKVFENALDLDLNIVPFDGGGTLMAKLAGNQVDAGVIHTPVGIDYIEKGDIAILALGGPRDAVAVDVADVPTFDDLGIPEKFMVYRSLFAPPGTPQERIDILAEAVEKMAKADHFQDFGAEWGVLPTFMPPEKAKELLKRDLETFKDVYAKYVE